MANPAQPGHRGELPIGDATVPYVSHVHVASHLAAAYSTSPFARRGEPSLVLVWDGGCFPRLYWVDKDGRIEPGGEVFPLIGHSTRWPRSTSGRTAATSCPATSTTSRWPGS